MKKEPSNKSKASISETPPADTLLRQFVGYSMKRAFLLIQDDMNRTLEPLGLRMMTFSTLAIVTENPGISQTLVARTLRIERSGVVLLVDELETSDLIERRKVKGDRRSYALYTTVKGRKLWRAAQTAVKKHEEKLFEHLSEKEISEMHAKLETISSYRS